MAPCSPSPETRPLLSQRTSYASTTPPAQQPTTPPQISRSDLIWILAGLWSAVFLGALDGTIVATLMTPIGNYFHKSNQASYIGTSYLLSVCCFTPLYGRLSDIIGRRGAMLLGLTLFGIGTIMCGLAPSMEGLIAARAIAGMGGGGVMTVSSVAVTDLIPLKQRGLYQGMANVLFGFGAGIGGPLGGWLNDNFGWRSAFLFQASLASSPIDGAVPILVFSFVLVALKVSIELPQEVKNQSLYSKVRRIDFFGSVTLATAVGCLLLGFSLKSTEALDWSNPIIYGLFIVSAISCAAFIFVEARIAPYPVLPLRLISQRNPLAVSLSNFFSSVSAFSMIYNVPLYFTAVRLSSASNAGLHLLPHSVAISTGSVFAGWLMRRTGKLYTLTVMSSLLTIGSSAMVALWNDHSAPWHLWLDITPHAFGMASLITTTLIAVISSVAKEDLAVATGITYLFRTTGQVLGVSLSGTVLQAVLLRKLQAHIHGPDAETLIASIRHSTDVIPSLDPETRATAISAYADALRVVFICQIAVNFLTFLCCLPIQENPLPGTFEEQEAQFRRNRNQRQDSESDADA
ncbi:vacuolar amino acid permease [Auriscalpium vulgare]|uniref:Vacuolar amino acid permease n=1 Tax=Auriscalpium vulgare TaxID=40419 RepID=A0ACB8S0D8_9AGAM|nr:vacuolar amino acid permease [Auriscalpium vulgare]